MAWQGLSDDVYQLFDMMSGCLDTSSDRNRGTSNDRSIWAFMFRGTAKDVGIRTRVVADDPSIRGTWAARSQGSKATHRDYSREHMRQLRASRKASVALPKES